MNWLKEKLTNMPASWITQIAHFAVCYGIVRTFPGDKLWIAVGIVAYAFVKEFWFDIKFEKPKVSGGWPGGLIDFIFLASGGLLGAWVGNC